MSGAYRHAVVADVCSLPFESRSFATIISNCVFEHIPDLGEALREAVRVLRPGGRLIFTVPTEKFNEWFYLSWLFRKLHLHGPAKKQIERYNRFQSHYHCYSVEEWTGILKDAGLRVEAHEYYASRGFAFLWSALDDTQHALARLMRVNKGTSSEAQASQMSERFTGSPVANLVARLCWVCLLPFHEGRVSSANRGAAILIQAVKQENGNEAGAREW